MDLSSISLQHHPQFKVLPWIAHSSMVPYKAYALKMLPVCKHTALYVHNQSTMNTVRLLTYKDSNPWSTGFPIGNQVVPKFYPTLQQDRKYDQQIPVNRNWIDHRPTILQYQSVEFCGSLCNVNMSKLSGTRFQHRLTSDHKTKSVYSKHTQYTITSWGEQLFGFNPRLVHVRLLHCMRVPLRNAYTTHI